MSMLLALLQVAAAAPPAPPPPIITRHADDRRHLLSVQASPVKCGSEMVRVSHAEPVIPTLRYGDQAPSAIEVEFRIDGDGRPLGIRTPGPSSASRLPDLLPSFAAWRFESGEARGDCTITFYPAAEPILAASPDTLARFLALGGSGAYRYPQAMDRMVPPGSNCLGNWPQLLTQVVPRLEDSASPSGSLAASMVTFDIAEDGTVRNARAVAGDFRPSIEHAGLKAVAQWHYADGPREGCAFPFVRRGNAPLAPPPPPAEAPKPCALDSEWQRSPRLVYPPAYHARGIEGWAIVAYDVAPWGEIGNLRVLAAEPTEEFGEAALAVVRSGRKPEGQGATGCTDRVMFRMPGRSD